MQKIYFAILLSCLLFVFISGNKVVLGQETTPTPTPNSSQATTDLQNKIKELQSKVSDLQGQANTLSSQIAVLDNQINLTELRIEANKRQISELTLDIDTASKKIDGLQSSLEDLSQAFIKGTRDTYIAGGTPPLEIFLLSKDAQGLLDNMAKLKIIQEHYRKVILETTVAKNDYENQKDILEDKKVQIESLKKQQEAYSDQLDQQKGDKQKLLAETKGSEATYQQLLAQAKAQLAGFQRFVTGQGGASILSNQTVCDDWGCYYNQRDGQWGNNSLNGTKYTLASDGCLVTAMAMVYTHLGKKGVTPQTINSNPSNFASYYPAFLNKTISAEGMTTSRVYATIDSELSSGRPVIIGIGAGPDHFVVFISGSNGDYTMHDPFVPNGNRVKFTDHYSISSINSIERVSY